MSELDSQPLTINPRYTDAALNLAVTLNDLGRYVEAREVYSRAIETSRAEIAFSSVLDGSGISLTSLSSCPKRMTSRTSASRSIWTSTTS